MQKIIRQINEYHHMVKPINLTFSEKSEVQFKRKVTHSGFKKKDPTKKYYKGIPKEISVKPRDIPKGWLEGKTDFNYFTDTYIVMKTGAIGTPIVFGGVSLLMILAFSYLWVVNGEISSIGRLIFVVSSFFLIFNIIYFFTMPKKENILNRMDGLITFTGYYWQNNITMTFEEVEFNYTTGDEDLSGAYRLQVVRPTIRSFELFSLGGTYSDEDMSMITWYMDKNRPLPLGTAFDEYRQKDFERRKAEGFPKPLYPSVIKTPETTKEQQKERKQIGGW